MDALLIIDVQNDFCPGGSLAVPNGDAVVPVINRLLPTFDHVIQTQDWHPANHRSFASSYQAREPYDVITMPYGDQVLWPDHCIQGSHGADFHPDLETHRTELILRKGFRPAIDSYSAFYENDKTTPTGMSSYLKERGLTSLALVGLATDFCVKWSALDAIDEGFEVTIVQDAVRGLDANGSLQAAWDAFERAGIRVCHSDELLGERP